MTQEQQLARLLAAALYQLGGELALTRELLEAIPDYMIVLDEAKEPGVIHLNLKHHQVLVGKIENDTIEVLL